MVFHVLNRGVGRMQLFSKEKDYAAFEGLLEETCESRPMRICAYCLLPNHWHFVLWPERDGDLRKEKVPGTVVFINLPRLCPSN
jgi:putative transposase